ncbi:uncharacterized protein LOC132946166 [Metopolophium dirhodum]|uniref:uncharacterized protein LOC132946166 n=1 Tax=Metopolophium dirhodum TaxID=44670 RepID=UPI0029907768|nr:uncharacterized protein LOC132946166 [Metopolophium dirhodum]
MSKICPSHIIVHRKENIINVQHWSTHLWHKNEIGMQRLHTEDRSMLAVQRVNDIRETEVGTDFKRIHLLEKRDLYNILRDYKINNNSIKRHENNFISVQLWVEQMKQQKDGKNPILYFKHRGQEDSKSNLSKDDFFLVIMTNFQAEMLLQFGNSKICIYGTHGLNSYSIQLYTLLVVDEYDNGVPGAFCFNNKSDTATYKLFFESVRSSIGIIKPSVFMSYDEPAFYNAWSFIMGPTPKQLLCTWHVLRNWSKNLSKIKSQDKKIVVFKSLKALLYEIDENRFYKELSSITNQLKSDEYTVDFGQYFITTYLSRIEKWALFNRKHIGINTNMYLEALHKNIKYCYLEGKQCRRLDFSINALMLLVRDKSFKRVIKISKEKKSSKMLQIISR